MTDARLDDDGRTLVLPTDPTRHDATSPSPSPPSWRIGLLDADQRGHENMTVVIERDHPQHIVEVCRLIRKLESDVARIVNEPAWPTVVEAFGRALDNRAHLDDAARSFAQPYALTRWVALSRPFRGEQPRDMISAAGRAFGNEDRFVDAARAARDRVVAALFTSGFRSLPADVRVGGVLATLLYRHGDERHPLEIVSPTSPTQREHIALRSIAARAYLPRFQLWAYCRFVLTTSTRPRLQRLGLILLGVLLLIPVVAALVNWLRMSAWVSLAALALAAFIAFLDPHGIGAGLALRLPATTVLGLASVLAFDKELLTSTGPTTTSIILPAAVLAGITAYFAIEARNHGTRMGEAALGACQAASLGFCYATATTAITVRFLMPLLRKDLALACIDVRRAVPLVASVALAFGVVLQVLWDDKPITYPLSHLDRALEVDDARWMD